VAIPAVIIGGFSYVVVRDIPPAHSKPQPPTAQMLWENSAEYTQATDALQAAGDGLAHYMDTSRSQPALIADNDECIRAWTRVLAALDDDTTRNAAYDRCMVARGYVRQQ
jgi:hypothetical protein